ncbi:MAG: UDP-N-acetylmuramate--L-alanine ligase, partial [Spirochaetes bacterium]|nr:UDP-N-acetylmuramate--L-alanine ligase [Spirochaetota bacterium]
LQIADHVFVTDIYPAREKPIPGVKSELISDTMKKNGYDKLELIHDMNDIPKHLNQINKSGDCVIFLGAGDIWKIAEKYLKMLKKIEEKEVEYA